jgi:hypothetical protein
MIHLLTMLIDKNPCNSGLVEFWLLRLIRKPNRNCQLTGGPIFLLGGSISVSIIRKPNFERKTEELDRSVSVNQVQPVIA